MKFLRRIHFRYSRLGKRRKKKLVWRKPTGRHNKMREKRRGKPPVVSIGFRKEEGKKNIIVNNIRELERADKKQRIIVGRVGKKRKMEMAKKAKEMKIELYNLNAESFIKKNEKRSAKGAKK